MELMTELLVSNQLTLYLPVVLVLVGAVLVFAFGFRSAEQPPFDKISLIAGIEDRRSVGKKRKIKDKKTIVNGYVTTVSEAKPDKPKHSPTKEATATPKLKNEKKTEPKSPKKPAEPVTKPLPRKLDSTAEAKNKKIKLKQAVEKPADYDDGNWETVLSKSDKKNKRLDSPVKKDKKGKQKLDKVSGLDKLMDEVNMFLQQNDNNNKNNVVEIIEKAVDPTVGEIEQSVVIVGEKKLKKEKKPKKEKEFFKNIELELPKLEEGAIEAEVQPQPVDVEVAIPEKPPSQPVAEGEDALVEDTEEWTEAKTAKKVKKKLRRDN